MSHQFVNISFIHLHKCIKEASYENFISSLFLSPFSIMLFSDAVQALTQKNLIK